MIDIKNKIIYRLTDLDKLVAYLVIICTITAASYIYFVGYNSGYLNVIHVIAILLVLVFSLTWLILRREDINNNLLNIGRKCNISIFKLSISLATIFYCISLIEVLFREEQYSRPLLYFVYMSISAGCLLPTIIYSCKKKMHIVLIFCFILLYAINLRISPLILFPNVIGTDPWFYQHFSTLLIDQSHIPDGFDYSRLPIFPLEIAITTLISDIEYKYSSFLSIGLIQIIIDLLAAYIIGSRLFDHKIGLVSSLIVSFSCHHINRGFEIIANTFGGSIIMILVLTLLFFKSKNQIIKLAILIIFMILLVMCHTVATATFFSILVGYYLLHATYNSSHPLQKSIDHIPYLFLVIFTIFTLFWWGYSSGHLGTIVESIAWGLSIDTQNIGISSISNNNEILISNIGMILGFSASFIGFYFMISNKYNLSKPNLSFIVAGIGMVLLAVGFFPYLGGLNIMGYRWWYIAQIFLAIPLSLTIWIVLGYLGHTNKAIVITSILVSVLAFLMVISPVANPDNHTLTPISAERTSFIQSEIIGAQFASINYPGVISSDYLFSTCKSSSVFGNLFQKEYTKLHSLDYELLSEKFEKDNSIKVIRQYIITNNFRTGRGIVNLQYDPSVKLGLCGFSKIYSNAEVYMYL